MPGFRRRGRNKPPPAIPSSSDTQDSDPHVGFRDTNENDHCSSCFEDSKMFIVASCGHQFCKLCVMKDILQRCACSLDGQPISESKLIDFLLLGSEDVSIKPGSKSELNALRSRIDSLTLIVNRLVEHLSIKNMICEASGNQRNGVLVSASCKNLPSRNKGPIIVDSDDSEIVNDVDQPDSKSSKKELRKLTDLKLLCKLSSDLPVDSTKSDLVMTSENVRQLLPRFWENGIANGWTDEEKVQRLRMVCDTSLQRLLDDADLFRKDWAYISSILYGEPVMSELGMIRKLGFMRQRKSETPHQWYLRVCGVVESSLPPGPKREWEIRSTFLRGLRRDLQRVIDTEKAPSMGALLQQCSKVVQNTGQRKHSDTVVEDSFTLN